MGKNNQDLTLAMQEMMAQMAELRAELASLKAPAQALPQPAPPAQDKPPVSTTRRKLLRRLAGGLLAGLAVGGIGASLPQQAEAKFVAAKGWGAIVVPPGGTLTGTVPSGTVYGLYATTDLDTDISTYTTNSKIGVIGLINTAASGSTYYGVFGQAFNYGVYGNSPDGIGVYGNSKTTGVYGKATAGTSYGVIGNAIYTGVRGEGGTYGVTGTASDQFGTGVSGDGPYTGVKGQGGSTGVSAVGTASDSAGIQASGGAYGIYASSSSFAGYFSGKVTVTGYLSKSGGGFKIDHPLDPANKYLYHSFVESPDMLNIYSGIATLNDQGEASVEMPEWFEVLNSNYRYQLTALDNASPNLHIAQRLKDRRFQIAGGLAGQEVSWMITGVRQDEWAKAYRSPVEENKADKERGKYLHPELFGQPEDMSVHPRPAASRSPNL